MSPETISSLLVALVVGGPAIITALSTRGRKIARMSRQQRRDLDEWEAWGRRIQQDTHSHNLLLHPPARPGETSPDALPIPDWPPHMSREDDES